MYYPQQSPGIAHKLPAHQHPAQVHDQSPWSRQHHPVLGPPGHAQPPTSPAYPLFTNGALSAMQHHPHPHMPGPLTHHHHHHQNSLSHPHFSSPPNGAGLQGHGLVQNGSPGSISTPQMTVHWQQQLLKCEMSRASRSPHHRARASAMASRTVQKSAIPITNPNAVKPAETNGVNSTATKNGDAASGSSPSATSATDASPRSTAAHADHPSSTVAPIAELPRPSAPKPPQSTWSSLDMGGVNIKSIPPTSGLFSFTFLINLYLNHNALSSIPPEIAKLRHLELLDLSGNNLMTIPVELGMLTSLKELYLFDNHLTTLPPELGTLHQLQTLGIEGNPLEPSLKQIVQKDGTPALISFLRDSCPSPPPPPQRVWRHLISQAERDAMDADPNCETLSVLCYNILCERCATERLYGYTPSWALSWDFRKELILSEILEHEADFVCLQEVDIASFEDFFLRTLGERDYEGVHYPKSRYKTMNETDRRLVDGCAIFFKASKYTLVEQQLIEFSALAMQRPDFKKTDDMFNRVLGKDHIAVACLLENKQTGTRIVIANAHIHWDPQYRDVKLVQVALLVEEVEKMANSFAKYPPRLPTSASGSATTPGASEHNASSRPPPVYSDGTKIPVIIAADLNSIPASGVYEFLSTGNVPPDHDDFMSHKYGKYTSEGLRHRLNLKSAYAAYEDVLITNYVPSFQGMIDYIWYSSGNLSVNSVLSEVDRGYLEKQVGFPNAHFPSDHLCIASQFRVRPPRDPQGPRPPPVFPESSRAHA